VPGGRTPPCASAREDIQTGRAYDVARGVRRPRVQALAAEAVAVCAAQFVLQSGCCWELLAPASGGAFAAVEVGAAALAGELTHELGAHVGRELPADDPAAVAVEDEREVAEAVPGADVGQIGDPLLVRAGRREVTLEQIAGPLERGLVRDRRALLAAANVSPRARARALPGRPGRGRPQRCAA
jgi:hypothetical protein